MSVTSVQDWVRLCLWGKAGGRCQYDGCNHPVYRDQVTKAEFNSAYIAHIVADKPTGPRGDPILSPQLAGDISNLMLLCDIHHRLIDKVDVAEHSVELLREMKRRHEDRIELLTSIGADRQSHVLLYGERIGDHGSHISFKKAADAMVPDRYPADPRAIELGLDRNAFSDNESSFWPMATEVLRRQFREQVKPRFTKAGVEHLSVFGLAPIPLLIELGRLLSDIPNADIYQLHREPADWKWRGEPEVFSYQVIPPDNPSRKRVALVLALSASITVDRITAVLGSNVDIWVVTHETPGNDFMQSAVQLKEFRKILRDVFNRIHTLNGTDAELHLFPAIPVSAAIEVGRVWQPKADLPFRVYDQNRKTNGFTYATDVRQEQ